MMTNAFGYSRVSGHSQVNGDGHPRQVQGIESFADTHDYTVLRIYREDAIPGKSDAEERPQFTAMLTDIAASGVTVVIVESMQRLARSYATQEKLIALLVSKGITLIAADTGEDITEAFMGDPMRRALVQIQGIFAELDKNLIVAKLRKARERKRSNFGRAEGRKPYGYMTGGKHMPDVQHPLEYPILGIIQNLHSHGNSAELIACTLNDRLLKSRDGKPWRASVIRKILSRPQVAQSCTETDSKPLIT